MSFLAQGAEARRGPVTCRDPTAGTSGTWFRTHHLSLPNQPARRLGKEASAWKTACRRSLQESAVRPGLALRLADQARGAHSPALPVQRAGRAAGPRPPTDAAGAAAPQWDRAPSPVWGGKTQLRGSGTCAILLRHNPVLALMSPVTPAARWRCLGPPALHARRAARPPESDGAPVRPRPPHHLPLQRVLLSSLPAPRAGTAGCYGDG